MSFLESNLDALNAHYAGHNLTFRQEGEVIKIIEGTPYYLYENSVLKEDLKRKYKAVFKPDVLWHIPENMVSILASRRLKLRPDRPVQELRERLTYFAEKIKEPRLKDSLLRLLKKIDFFSGTPCTQFYHHAYEHGLLEHTVQLLDLSTNIAKTIEDRYAVDSDLLIAGCILHDAGKIHCYKYTEEGIKTTEAQHDHAHIVQGIKITVQHIQSEKIDGIIHIIASHHGVQEWGSPVKPRTPEAWIIHTMDYLSSRILG